MTLELSAALPLDTLTLLLGHAGWGVLADEKRGVCWVLDALGGALPTGSGEITAQQLAVHACYTERWVRHCLTRLEELDLIVWQRGGISGNGRPVSSWIKVSKPTLIDLIRRARDEQKRATS